MLLLLIVINNIDCRLQALAKIACAAFSSLLDRSLTFVICLCNFVKPSRAAFALPYENKQIQSSSVVRVSTNKYMINIDTMKNILATSA